MTLLGIAGYILSTLITIVLAVSPGIIRFLAYTSDLEKSTTEMVTVPNRNPVASSLLSTFSESIRKQLHTDVRYQQATVAEAVPTSSSVSTTTIEAALVNIFCTAYEHNTLRTVTGSGVFIDEQGVVLTNAHIAQFLLLRDTAQIQAQCMIRQGDPTVAKYTVDLLYVSPAWITHNAHQLSAPKPSGTGEYDFALLYVTSALEGDLPESFPSLIPAPTTYLFSQMSVRVAGYPAEMLTADNVRAPLASSVATTSITQLLTFGSGKIDLVAIAPSIVGQQGSSGGPVVREDGGIVGLIVTRGNITTEGARSLRALTLPYIDRTLVEETGLDLAHTLSGNIPLRAQVFHETVTPYLRTLLLDTL